MNNYSYNPGSLASIILEVNDSDGYRANSLTDPVINQILGFTSADGYSTFDGYFGSDGYTQTLTQVSVGLYFVKLTLPKTAASLGSYVVEVHYTDPDTGNPLIRSYQLVVSSAFGSIGATTF